MEKTKFTLFMLPAVALFLFVACSGENDLTAETPTAQQKETPSNAIGFDAYLNRTTTRAGWAGNLETGDLQGSGFGVFAYYGDGDLYSENLVPNFMYNQYVQYDNETGWGYEPVKYWPNEHGSSAVSMGVDRVTFFAYAPYVGVDPASGQLTSYYDNTIVTSSRGDKYERLNETGITWLSRNGKGGDPYVRYVTSFEPDKCVDICYGVAKSDFTSSVDNGDGINHIEAGEPYLNVAKPTTDAKIDFLFKHALAKLNVKVDADVDVAGHDESDNFVGNMTRVWIRSITFDGVAQRGFMNMRTGEWYSMMDNTKISKASVTIHDGRRDGAEAIADDTYEEPLGLNPKLVQSNEYETTTYTANGVTAYETFKVKDNIDPATTPTGVKRQYQNLFGSNGSIMVIPANEQLKVTIVYDVETADATLPYYLSDAKTKGSTIENKITKAITLGSSPLKLEAGKAYNINLHLGMTSVTFTANAASWESATNADDTWLPQNIAPTVTIGNPLYCEVPAASEKAEFKVVGLTSGHTINATESSANITGISPASTTVPDGGEILYTVSLDENNTVSWVDNTITVTDATSSTSTTITLVQLEKPFVPSCTITNGATTFEISQGTGSGVAGATDWGSAEIRHLYKRNGTEEYTELELTDDSPTGNQFNFSTNTNKVTVTLGTAAASGDIYKIDFKIGNSFVTFIVEV